MLNAGACRAVGLIAPEMPSSPLFWKQTCRPGTGTAVWLQQAYWKASVPVRDAPAGPVVHCGLTCMGFSSTRPVESEVGRAACPPCPLSWGWGVHTPLTPRPPACQSPPRSLSLPLCWVWVVSPQSSRPLEISLGDLIWK